MWLLDKVFGVDAEIERGREIDRQTEAFNRAQLERGAMTLPEYEAFNQSNDWAGDQYSADVERDFWDGAAEAWDRVVAQPATTALGGAAKAVKTAFLIQAAVAALAIYLAYRYFKAGGRIL